MSVSIKSAVVLASIYLAAHATAAIAQPPPAGQSSPPAAQSSQIGVAYVQPGNRNFQPIYDRVKNRKVLEELQQFLAPLRLPRKLTVKIDQCGALSRPYRPQEPVTICYELIDQIEKVAAKGDPKMRQTMIAGAFIQVVVYQVAHAMFDILQVPVWGRAGDAADRLAALVMLQFGEDLALRTIRGSTAFFLASKKTWTGSAFADADSPEEQRYYNYLCIAYGGSPISFDFLVSGNEPVLPLPRARRCYWEYQQVRMAFNLRIMPFVDPDLLVKIRSADWLLPGDVR
jgi:Putative metallopeptidase